ncbi:MAG TPA: winged helix DNA-binding domain-containing protein, partial [Gemmatimonadaceae bacterium]|nr:winged helix DNA-binding domain-containing protein [Gemmatimonadaceae bacterium]
MKLEDVARARLANQRLIDSDFQNPVDVVSALGAIQAQDYPGAKWAIGLRAPSTTDASVEAAVDEGSIIRTHVLRPTWHLVRPTDLRWMLDLTAKRIKSAMAFGNRWLGFDEATFRRAAKALERSLEGRALTRSELAAVFERARVNVKGDQRLGHLLMNAELDCVICSGPRQGKHATYALFDERIAAAPSIDRDEALLRLTTIYFTTRGPATEHDFAWWSGLTVRDARRGLEMASRDLERVTISGRSYWTSALTTAPKKRAVVHLLPNYDEFFIAYR